MFASNRNCWTTFFIATMFDEPDILPDKISTDVQQRRQER